MSSVILSASYAHRRSHKSSHYHDCHQIIYITAGTALVGVYGAVTAGLSVGGNPVECLPVFQVARVYAAGSLEVGEGIRASGVKREDIFLTTKHWVTERGYEKTIATIEKSLEQLGVDYLDLYLIHWPCVAKVADNWKEQNAETWRGFEKMYKDGKIRALGVSNFQPMHLEALFETAEIKPMVNQLEFHPGYTQIDNIRWCQANGILPQAWSPLGNGTVLNNPELKAMAEKYGKSVAQLCVRFALQCGVQPLPKSTNPQRMTQNADVFDFVISDEDVAKLINFPQLGFTGWLPEDAPADALANGN